MKNTTIQEFLKITRQEHTRYIESCKHADDEMSLDDWRSENESSYAKEYGIVRNKNYGDWSYDSTNSNWCGDEVCHCCNCYYDLGKEGDENLCGECLDDFNNEYDSSEDYWMETDDVDALGRNYSDADNGL